jgi:DNA mismatch endonuclease, patch repair protein
MPDKFSKEIRSKIMSRIRKTDSKPEVIVRKFLFSNGFRYRLNVRKLPGCPDIVLPKYKTILFINGCFWHAHNNCKYNKMPKSNYNYWIPKINGNVKRDIVNRKRLQKMGWKILILWECEIIGNNGEKLLRNLIKTLKKRVS